MSIFKVVSNISHNGNHLSIGQIFEAGIEEFEHLVKLGALKIIEKAESVEEAKVIDETEKEPEIVESEATDEEQNTWGPKKDEPIEKKQPETVKEPIVESEKEPEVPTTGAIDGIKSDEIIPDKNSPADIGDDL